MKISVVIPTYNRGYIIEKSLLSVLEQNYENLEIIISDNCSTDNTYEVISKYLKDKRIKYFKNKQNLGLIKNFNISLKEYSTGDFIMHVSDDDILLKKDYISRAVKYIKRNSLSWIAAGSYHVNIKYKIYKENINKNFMLFSNNDFFKFHKWGLDNFVASTILFDRKKALKLGGFNENLYNFDFELIFKLAIDSNVGIMNTSETFYAMTDNQSNYLVKPQLMFGGYSLYENIKDITTNKQLHEDLNTNIKYYLSGCFKYYMDRDAFNEMDFDDKYWFNYFKDLKNGKYFPFLDDDTKQRYELFKKDKEKFRKSREVLFSNTWEKVKDEKILDFIRAFDVCQNS